MAGISLHAEAKEMEHEAKPSTLEVGLAPRGDVVPLEPENNIALPSEVSFLSRPECNLDMNDNESKKQGCLRKKEETYRHSCSHTMGREKASIRCRDYVGFVVNSWLVQGFVLLVIALDLLMTLAALTDNLKENGIVGTTGAYLVVLVMSIDVFARFFVAGLPFLKGPMNLFELLLVPTALAEMFLLSKMNLPLPLLRALRPIFRLFRVVRIIVRTAGKGQDYIKHLRRQVSGDRVRFVQDGFDLDLAYITSNIVAMPAPAVGREVILHNPASEVARYLNGRHLNKYLLLNTTPERRYPLAPFFYRYLQFPIQQDGVPTLASLRRLCHILQAFLMTNTEHVLIVHSKHGQGRVALVIIAYLIYSDEKKTVDSALELFRHSRIAQKSSAAVALQSIDSWSQRRFLDYFAEYCRSSTVPRLPRSVQIRRVNVTGLPDPDTVDVVCFAHPDTKRHGHVCKYGLARSNSIKLSANDDDLESAASMPLAKITQLVSDFSEKRSFDSRMSGCTSLCGKHEHLFNSAGTTNVKCEDDETIFAAVWDIAGLNIEDEICIEIHRRADTTMVSTDVPLTRRCLNRLTQFLLRLPLLRRFDNSVKVGFQSGLLFACWLHADFLELNEMPQSYSKASGNTVTIELDRFTVDKGSFAPSLRSYSTAFKVSIDFVVSARYEMRSGNEQMKCKKEPPRPPPPSSGFESLDWFTWVAERIWPSFNHGFETLVKENIVPSLRDGLPSVLKNVRLAEFSLGEEFPRFTSINACHEKNNDSEVQLDIQLGYDTATNIVLDFGVASMGIKHLRIHGMLSLRFKPILAELPVFSAIELLFINNPEIDLRFGKGLQIANIDIIHKVVMRAINQSVSDYMVLPNVMKINWSDPACDDMLSFESMLPRCLVRVGVVSARGLTADGAMFKKAPDAYVTVTIGSQTKQTSTKPKSSDPTWNQKFDFLVHDLRQFISLSVLDVDITGRGKCIGRVSGLTVATLLASKELPLNLEGTGPMKSSSICVGAESFRLDTDPAKFAEQLSGEQRESALFRSEKDGTSRCDDEDVDVDRLSEVSGGTEVAEDEAIVALEENDETIHPTSGSAQESGIIGLLVCEVFGGRMPQKMSLGKGVSLALSIGKTRVVRTFTESANPYVGEISSKLQQSVEKLASSGHKDEAIAADLDLNLEDVQRVIRKRGWTVEMRQKLCMMLHPVDLRGAKNVKVEIVRKRRPIAKGEVAIATIMGSMDPRCLVLVKCEGEGTQGVAVELDAAFWLFNISDIPYYKPEPSEVNNLLTGY